VPEADGVALFARRALGLREAIPVRVPFQSASCGGAPDLGACRVLDEHARR
jgi:hypothetical protein